VFANALNGGFVGGLGGLVAAVGGRGVATTAHGGTGSGAGRTLTARTARTTTLFALGARRAVQRRRIVAAQGVALVDPHLHADDAVGRLGFGEAVVDVGTQGVQRHTAFAVPLGTGDFDAVQTARGHDLDALGAQAHGVLHRAFHGAAEHDALFELLADRVGDQLGIDFGLAHFLDVDSDRHTQLGGQVLLQALDVLALLADHHTRAGRVDGDAGVLGGALDHDARNGGVLELGLQVLAHLDVFGQHAGEVTVAGVPAAGPVARRS